MALALVSVAERLVKAQSAALNTLCVVICLSFAKVIIARDST